MSAAAAQRAGDIDRLLQQAMAHSSTAVAAANASSVMLSADLGS